jgi:hypothetical protein
MNSISNKNYGFSSLVQVFFETVIENILSNIGIEST